MVIIVCYWLIFSLWPGSSSPRLRTTLIIPEPGFHTGCRRRSMRAVLNRLMVLLAPLRPLATNTMLPRENRVSPQALLQMLLIQNPRIRRQATFLLSNIHPNLMFILLDTQQGRKLFLRRKNSQISCRAFHRKRMNR